MVSFKFGTGLAVKAKRIVKLPVMWREKVFNLKLNVMEDEVPFLSGMEAIAKMGMIIDLKRKMMEIGSTTAKMKRNQMGQIIWDELKCDDGLDDLKTVQEIFWTAENDEISKREIQKIHENLDDASVSKMMDLLKRTKMGKLMTDKVLKERVMEVTNNCEPCVRIGNSGSKSKIATIRASTFNERVAIDLSEWWDIERKEKLVICHIVLSRLSSAGLVKTKEPQAILQCILHEWISKYGPPKILLSDNGPEFIKDDTRCFLDRINVRHINTAAFAPFSNGIVERHNGVRKRKQKQKPF